MSEKQVFEVLNELSEKNDEHVEEFSDKLKQHLDGQDPEVTTILCSDSRVIQGKICGNEVLGREFSHERIGNRTNSLTLEGEVVPSGSIDYIPEHSDTPTGVLVIGHTGCGAVTATYDTIQSALKSEEVEEPEEIIELYEKGEIDLEDYTGETKGITTDIYLLMKAGLDSSYKELMDEDLEDKEMINRLVEYNVDNQVEFLKEHTDYEDTEILGAVYDMEGVYGENGGLYLVNYDGRSEIDELEQLFSDYSFVDVDRQDSA